MLKLVKLELRRIHLYKHYFVDTCIISGFLVFFLMLNTYIEPGTLPGNEMVPMFLSIITATTGITGAFVFNQIVIGEYDKKTINILYSYPISRRKIILSKLMIVAGFVISANIIFTMLVHVVVWTWYSFLGMASELGSLLAVMNMFIDTIPILVSSGCLILIPCYLGLRKKSRGMTVGMSILVMTILVSNSGGFSLQNVKIIPISLGVLALLLSYKGIINKVEKEDV